MPDHRVHPASYRDPSGFVFQSGSLYYRQVNKSYASDYEELLHSGLYEALTRQELLVPHTEVEENLTGSPGWYKTLLPRQIAFTSYPSEWSPAQLKDAALLTLKILSIAIDHGMILKDATPLNIQFIGGKPVFIDTLSFEKYDASLPWVAYRQFCESMLFPLYLQHYLSTGTHWILSAWPEGIPAGITAGMLPLKSRFRLGVWLHVWLQSRIQQTHGSKGGRRRSGDEGQDVSDGKQPGVERPAFSKEKLMHLVNNLEGIVSRMKTDDGRLSVWNNYYESTISSQPYLEAKEKLFRGFIGELEFGSAMDLGANDGYFSKILAERWISTGAAPAEKVEARDEKARVYAGTKEGDRAPAVVAVDFDWRCIQRLYDFARQQSSYPILPLVIDLSNPTPASGFHHTERASFSSRFRSDLVIALALIHHLALAKNIPLPKIAAYLADLTREYLIVEFVPLSDEKSKALVRAKSQWQKDYDERGFEAAFTPYFTIERKETISGSERILYLLKWQHKERG